MGEGRARRGFDPAPYRRELVAIIDEIAGSPGIDRDRLDRCLRRYPRDGRGFFSRSEIIAGFRRFSAGRRWGVDEDEFVDRLRLRPIRTLSGVTPVAVLTRPHPCPGRCIFCPTDERMPKSYLADEPGAQRAADNHFDPYRQTRSRLAALREIGHPVAKVELIVLGGTWSSYPEPYRIWFARRCFEALNDFGRGAARRSEEPPEAERAGWRELEAAQRENEAAACRCVGLAVETRPDRIDEAEVRSIRRLGVTKVQIGIQSLRDEVLALNRRGHGVASTRRALALLRRAGLKIHAHWMANLLGSTPEADEEDFARLFDDPDFRPDELKLYPCSLIESAELMEHYRRGEWRPYRTEELLELVAGCLERTPPYCRVTRVIRDFSARDIAAGSRTANLRELAERRLRAAGRSSREIRSREIRDERIDAASLRLGALEYPSSTGREVFLQFTAAGDRLVGFLRLSLPKQPCYLDEIRQSALIRELHVYGASLGLGRRAEGRPQHSGLGRALIARAAARAREAGFESLAVVSAVGTRGYYRELGFRDGPLYQHRRLPPGRR